MTNRLAISEAAAKEWWSRLSLEEQLDYIHKHPHTRLKPRRIDVPIGTAQYLPGGQRRLMTHNKGWVYFDRDEDKEFKEEQSEVESFLEMMGRRINRKTAGIELTDNEIDEIIQSVVNRILDEETDPDSIDKMYKHKVWREKNNTGIVVPMREDRDSSSGDYSTFEQIGPRPRMDV